MDRKQVVLPRPYHPGEIEVQRRAGVLREAERVGRIIGSTLTPTVARLMSTHRLVVAASLDGASRVWVSLLTGPRGFLRPLDETLMLIESHPGPLDPLGRNLESSGDLGLVAIDLETRQRMRFNGKALWDPDHGIFLKVEQVYGNCPKYIQARRIDPGAELVPSQPGRSPVMNAGQQALVSAADTMFIGSFHPEGGADASHRGGAPGFVKLLDECTLAFADYPGNNMFNTLGNLAACPRAGLLFLDFESGTTLQVTGEARLDRNPACVADFRGARDVVVIFEVEEAIETPGGGVTGRLVDYSPVNP